MGVSLEVLLIPIIGTSYSNKKDKMKYEEKLGGQVKTMYRQEKISTEFWEAYEIPSKC